MFHFSSFFLELGFPVENMINFAVISWNIYPVKSSVEGMVKIFNVFLW